MFKGINESESKRQFMKWKRADSPVKKSSGATVGKENDADSFQ